MPEVPLEVVQHINRVCDEFETALRSAAKADIRDYLHDTAQPYQCELLKWLVATEIDNAWQMRSKVQSPELEPRKLEGYLQQFPVLGQAEERDRLRELVRTEFRARQQAGDRPSVEATVRRFADDADWLTPALRSDLNEISPITLGVWWGHRLTRFALRRLTEIGRQRAGEPQAVSLIKGEPSDRLIIANADELRVARRHVNCDLIANNLVQVRNYSERSVTAINAEEVIPPNSTCVREVPFVLNLGPKSVEIKWKSPSGSDVAE